LSATGKQRGDSTAFGDAVKQMNSIVKHCIKTDGLLSYAYDQSRKATRAVRAIGLWPEV
jgi:hypothetical protein